jgi:hypothetical protein
MKWELAIVAAALLVVAAVSGRLTDTWVTPAMIFVLIGLLVGPLVLDDLKLGTAQASVRTLAEATLAVVLFADASRIRLRLLRKEYSVPLRLLMRRWVSGRHRAAAPVPHPAGAQRRERAQRWNLCAAVADRARRC